MQEQQQQSLRGKANGRRPLRNRESRTVRSTITATSATPWTCWEEFDHVGRDLLQALSLHHRHHHDDDDQHSSSSSGPPSTSPTAQRRTTETEDVKGGSAAAAVGAAERSEDPQQHVREQEEEKVDEDWHRQRDTVVVRQALDQVEIWWVRAAGPGSLPHAVESTHALALCLHTDYYHHQGTLESSASSSFSLSLMYASSMTRTVNGFTDVLQQSRAVASSVAHLAHLLGMPGWVVDIRHQSTHNALPSLPLLRTAAQTLLLYLDQVYWTPLRQRRQQYTDMARQLLLEAPPPLPSNATQQDGYGTQGIWYDDDCFDGDDESSVDGSDVDEGECDDEDGDEPIPIPSRSVTAVPHKVLGTTFNRFAALLDDTATKRDKKAKKKKGTASDLTSTEVEPPTTRRGRTEDPVIAEPAADASPSHVKSTRPAAAIMTWNDVPLDVMYRAAADHVLQYCRQANGSPPPLPASFSSSTTVPSELTAFVELARRYPGLVSFVTRELELRESSMTSDDAADSEREQQTSVCQGRAWAEYLGHLVAQEPPQATGTAPRNKRPRHEASTAANSIVHDTAASILRRYGAGVGTKLRTPIKSDESTSQTINLEDMEALLNQSSTGGKRKDSAQSPESAAMNGSTTEECSATRTAGAAQEGYGRGGWSLCQSWEPCAIGSLGRNDNISR